ncbi:MAG TPA: hypothetical protein VF746_03275 [Longimicrobium sp.]|jgi:hypothetical protein
MPNPQLTPASAQAGAREPFLDLLTEACADGNGGRVFAPLPAGTYLVAVQASALHRWCEPRAAVPPAAVAAWEVFVTDASGRAVGPATHPWLFRRRPWVFHWLNAAPDDEVPVGRLVPAWVVQQLLDFLRGSAPTASLAPR